VISERPVEPAAQQAPTHGSDAAIHDARQGQLVAAHQAQFQFQVTPRGGIQYECVIAPLHHETREVGQGGALGLLHVLQQRAGGGDRRIQAFRAETRQIPGMELGGEQARGGGHIEMPGRTGAAAVA
jgi:hypothetical protein